MSSNKKCQSIYFHRGLKIKGVFLVCNPSLKIRRVLTPYTPPHFGASGSVAQRVLVQSSEVFKRAGLTKLAILIFFGLDPALIYVGRRANKGTKVYCKEWPHLFHGTLLILYT